MAVSMSTGTMLWAQVPESSSKKSPKQQYVAANSKNEKSVKAKNDVRTATDSPVPGVNAAGGFPSYRVGVDDDLLISVWHEPELSQAVVVRPDGMITLPLLGDIKAAGLTTEELQAVLAEKMKTLVNEPQVTVLVKAVKSRKVYAMGAVAKQGVYPLSGKLTVLELIAEAGGLGPFAKTRSIYILRTVNSKQVRIGFHYKKALSGKGDNPQLQPGDMVVVP